MKVVVQNGVNHPLTRKEAEELICKLASRWSKVIETVTLYNSGNSEMHISYHKKEKCLGIHCPSETENKRKEEAINMLYLAFGSLKIKGEIMNNLSLSKKEDYIKIGKHEFKK